jgi:cytochrome b561
MKLEPAAYSRTAIVIHWLTAAALALVVALGLRMTETGGVEKARALNLHMGIGISILLLTVLRLAFVLRFRLCLSVGRDARPLRLTRGSMHC